MNGVDGNARVISAKTPFFETRIFPTNCILHNYIMPIKICMKIIYIYMKMWTIKLCACWLKIVFFLLFFILRINCYLFWKRMNCLKRYEIFILAHPREIQHFISFISWYCWQTTILMLFTLHFIKFFFAFCLFPSYKRNQLINSTDMTTRNYVWNIVVVDCAKKKTQITVAYIDVNGLCLATTRNLRKKKDKITSKHTNSKEKIIKNCHKTEFRICVLRFDIHMEISINEQNENSKVHLFCCTLNKYVVWSSNFICLFENVERDKNDWFLKWYFKLNTDFLFKKLREKRKMKRDV